MKISDLLTGFEEAHSPQSKRALIDDFEIWTTLEEAEILKKLSKPVKLSTLSEHEQFKIQAMIRKSLVTKVGMENPTVVANEKIKT
jgi:hypothetical protein